MRERNGALLLDRTPSMDFSHMKDLFHDTQVMNLVCSIGHNEIMALTTILSARIAPTERPTISTLRKELDRAQGSKTIKPGSRLLPDDRVKPFLIYSGILDTDRDPQADFFGSVLTASQKGRTEAFAFAGDILSFSLKYKPSLYGFFGQSVGAFRPDRQGVTELNVAPATRIKIFEILTSQVEPLTSTILAYSAGRHRSKGTSHLRSLSANKIITYESVGYGESPIQHRLAYHLLKTGTLPKELGFAEYPRLSKLVYSVLYENEFQGDADWLSVEKTVEKVIEKNPKYGRGQGPKSKDALMSKVRMIYKHFATHELVETVGFEPGTKSKVSLTTEQRQMLGELLDILRRYQAPDEKVIEEGKRKALEIITDPEKVRFLLEKAIR